MGLLDKLTGKENKYYSLDNILKLNAHYNVIFGERSNGKTYAVLKYAIQKYFKDGSQLAIIRRWNEDFTGKRGQSMFSALAENSEVTTASGGEYNTIYYYSSRWYFALMEDGKMTKKSDIPFAYGFAITAGEHDKSTSYPNVRTILFDEFISRDGYIPDEFVHFENVISTIVRENDEAKIFMLGNTVNKYCPYFNEMGLYHIKEQKQGIIDTYRYGDSKLLVAVEYCKSTSKSKKSNVYFAFNNPKLSMITSGEWEIMPFPHLDYKYIPPRSILYTFYISFDGDTLKCDIINFAGNDFIYIAPYGRKDPPEGALIYSTEYSPLPNHRRNIMRSYTKGEESIQKYFDMEKVFYSNNETGYVVWNYIDWCKKN